MTATAAPIAPRRTPWDLIKVVLLPAIPFLIIIAVWASARVLLDKPISVLPRVTDVFEVPFKADKYWTNVRASIWRLTLGFIVAATSGVFVGLIAGLSKRVSEFLNPIVTAMNAISGIAWIPLAIAWLGVGTSMVVFIIWNAAFFLIFGNTMLGVRLTPQILEDSLLTLGATRRDVLRQVVFPGAMPYIMSGLRSGLGFGWRAVIAAELVGATSGLGQWIFEQQEFARADNIVAGALTIGVIGLLMDRVLLAPLEKRTIEKWGLVESTA